MAIEDYDKCGWAGCGCPPIYRVVCDDCGTHGRAGPTPGDAAHVARTDGFRTIPGARVTDPVSWVCPRCYVP